MIAVPPGGVVLPGSPSAAARPSTVRIAFASHAEAPQRDAPREDHGLVELPARTTSATPPRPPMRSARQRRRATRRAERGVDRRPASMTRPTAIGLRRSCLRADDERRHRAQLETDDCCAGEVMHHAERDGSEQDDCAEHEGELLGASFAERRVGPRLGALAQKKGRPDDEPLPDPDHDEQQSERPQRAKGAQGGASTLRSRDRRSVVAAEIEIIRAAMGTRPATVASSSTTAAVVVGLPRTPLASGARREQSEQRKPSPGCQQRRIPGRRAPVGRLSARAPRPASIPP